MFGIDEREQVADTSFDVESNQAQESQLDDRLSSSLQFYDMHMELFDMISEMMSLQRELIGLADLLGHDYEELELEEVKSSINRGWSDGASRLSEIVAALGTLGIHDAIIDAESSGPIYLKIKQFAQAHLRFLESCRWLVGGRNSNESPISDDEHQRNIELIRSNIARTMKLSEFASSNLGAPLKTHVTETNGTLLICA